MDVKSGGEVSMSERRATNGAGGEMVITISNEDTLKGSSSKEIETLGATRQSKPSSPAYKESSADGFAKSVPVSFPSPEISRFGNSPVKPPKIPNNNENLARKRSLSRSVLSKPKSRFGEQPYTVDATMFEENSLTLEEQISKNSPFRNSLNRGSPDNKSAPGTRTNSINQKTPLMASPGGPNYNDDDDYEEIYKKVEQSTRQKKRRVEPKTLSGPPLVEEAMRVGRSPSMGHLILRSNKKGKGTDEKKVIDMGKFHKMKQEKVSAWTMKVFVDDVTNSWVSTISNTLDETVDDYGEQTEKEITNEMEAIAAAYHIFRNVAQPGSKYIEEADLLRFMIKEEVEIVILWAVLPL